MFSWQGELGQDFLWRSKDSVTFCTIGYCITFDSLKYTKVRPLWLSGVGYQFQVRQKARRVGKEQVVFFRGREITLYVPQTMQQRITVGSPALHQVQSSCFHDGCYLRFKMKGHTDFKKPQCCCKAHKLCESVTEFIVTSDHKTSPAPYMTYPIHSYNFSQRNARGWNRPPKLIRPFQLRHFLKSSWLWSLQMITISGMMFSRGCNRDISPNEQYTRRNVKSYSFDISQGEKVSWFFSQSFFHPTSESFHMSNQTIRPDQWEPILYIPIRCVVRALRWLIGSIWRFFRWKGGVSFAVLKRLVV